MGSHKDKKRRARKRKAQKALEETITSNVTTPRTSTRKVVIPYGDETIEIEYNPLTAYARAAELRPRMATDRWAEKLDVMVDWLLSVMISWDLTDEELIPLPITKEEFQTLSILLVHDITEAILEDLKQPHD